MSTSKASNVKSAMSNPRTRTIFLGTIIGVIVMVVVLGMILSGSGESKDPALASEVTAAPEVQGSFETAGESTAEYDALLAASNKESAENALADGTSSIPVPRGTVEQSLIDPAVEPTTPSMATAPAAAVQPVVVPPPMNPTDDPAYQAALTANEQAIAQRQLAMQAQATRLQSYWKFQSHQQTLIARERVAGNGSSGVAATDQAQYQAALAAADVTAADVRAGDQLYATLDTAINSDEAGPVIATVRQPGPFQGARLIGQMSMGQDAKAVGVQFTAMAVPGEKATRSINAWAVDPNKDNRAALATDVDNHYLSNGAKIFIGSFLAGYSDGLLRGGQNESVVSNGTTTVVQKDAYTDRQLIEIGVGNVGRTVSQNLSQGSTRRRTVKVAAGIDIGVLFLQDAAPQR